MIGCRFLKATATKATAALFMSLMFIKAGMAVDAGSVIENVAVIDYSIAGVEGRPVKSDPSNIVVDRALSIVVQNDEIEVVDVFPGKENAVLRFTVSNLGNSTIDILLIAANAVSYTDSDDETVLSDAELDSTVFQVFVDDGDGLYEPSSDTRQYIDNIPPDDSVLVFVVADIPNNYLVGDLSALNLIAQVAEPEGIDELGEAIVQDDSGRVSPTGIFESGEETTATDTVSISKNDNLNTVLDVFIDGAGLLPEDFSTAQTQDTAFNGQHSDTAAFVSIALPLELIKSAEIIDPDGGTEPYEGATIRYSLTLRTLSGADNVVISDVVPEGTTYINGTLTLDGNTITDVGDADSGDFNETLDNAVYVDLGSVSADEIYRVNFDVLIN